MIFLYFGWPKIKDLRKNAEHFSGMGFKPGIFWGTIVALLEFFGGLALIFGILPSLFALLFVVHMLVGTAWKMFGTDKKFPDYSYDLTLLAILLLLLAFGNGWGVILEKTPMIA
ncbi:DoxX family protein [Candidatus Gracilibacteria bacterium]|nr:DoxX family protein [Candidatus Gracilibacteria bacterium]